MSRTLLYSPDVIGHPRVYCRVIADALSQSNCDVVVAIGFTDAVGLAQSPDLHPLVGRDRLRLVETRDYSRTRSNNLKAEEIVALQREVGADRTLFIEADKSNDEFKRIASGDAPRLLGRNFGIFSNTGEWYPGEDSFTGEPRPFLAPRLRTTLGNMKRAIFERKQSVKYFYENIIIRPKVLDEVFVKDERLAEWYGPPVYWMPEISRPNDQTESEADAAEYEIRKRELGVFLAANVDREPVLYFGDAAYYKGYDLFLQFVEKNPATCAIHAGLSYSDAELSRLGTGVELLRVRLKAEGRLHETNGYVHSRRLKVLYFNAIRLYVTTHRLALSSSTVVQALELGKPVLVPNRGLLGHRVSANGLGCVYEYESIDSMTEQAQFMWKCNLDSYVTAAHSFWLRFSDESILQFFTQKLSEPSHEVSRGHGR